MKHKFTSKRHWAYKPTPLTQTDEMAIRYDDVINLSVGDPDYPVDRLVIDKMYQDTLKGHTKYTEFLGDGELRQEICNYYRDDFGCNFTTDQVIITSGGTSALYTLMETILDEEDEVILISPYYIYYEPQVELARGKVVLCETKSKDNFEPDIEALKTKINAKTKAVIVNSPTNPTGKVYKEETIKELIGLANRHDFLIIADDIYGVYNYTERIKPICAYEPDNPRIITIYSFSKDYAMTGFRLGYVIAEKPIVDTLLFVSGSVSFTVNAMAQRAGIHALRDRKRIQKEIYEEYKKRVFYAYERVSKMKNMRCYLPEGTFYLFVDIRETNLTSEEIWEKILDEAHVLVVPGNGFGSAGEGFIRIACTCGLDMLKKAFDRMQQMDIFQ